MAKIDITQTATLNASVDDVWRILADEFLDVDRWASAIDRAGPNPSATAAPSGAPADGRSCSLAGFGTTSEQLDRFNATAKTLGYSVSAKKIPGFVRDMRNDWSVTAAGPGRCTVTSTVTANASGIMGAMIAPMMRMKLKATQKQLFDDLRVYAETGRPSAAKQKALSRVRG